MIDVQKRRANALVIDPTQLTPLETLAAIKAASIARIPVYSIDFIHEHLTGHISHPPPKPYYHLHSYQNFSISANLKNIFDILLLMITSWLWLPVMGVVALCILITMGRPVFFKQKRNGQYNKPFTIYKFRTMSQSNNDANETQTDDKRISALGKRLRKYRLDELPQFFNIIKGDMHLIGPRPERPELADKYVNKDPSFAWRQLVKPGITGWAQVNQGYAVGTHEALTKVKYDIYYIKHNSFWLDIKIFIKTFYTIFTGFGAK